MPRWTRHGQARTLRRATAPWGSASAPAAAPGRATAQRGQAGRPGPPNMHTGGRRFRRQLNSRNPGRRPGDHPQKRQQSRGPGRPPVPDSGHPATVARPQRTDSPGDRLRGPLRRKACAALPAARIRGRYPIRTYVRRPNRPPLLYFPAALSVRTTRISPLTSGTKQARTADLLHACEPPACPRPTPYGAPTAQTLTHASRA
jgi:hypothetical protein